MLNEKMYVRFVPYTGSSKPKGFDPIRNQLPMDVAYRVIDINSYADADEAYFGIVDLFGRAIWISNRHLRVVEVESKITTSTFRVSKDCLLNWSYRDAVSDFNDIPMPIERYMLKTSAQEYLDWYKAKNAN